MKKYFTKNLIIIYSIVLVIIIFSIIVYINYTKSPQGVSGQYKEVINSNDLDKDAISGQCDDGPEICIQTYYKIITANIRYNLTKYNINNKDIDEQIEKTSIIITRGDYTSGLVETKKLVEIYNNVTKEIKESDNDAQSLIKQYTDINIKVTDSSFNNDWASYFVVDKDKESDEALMILKRSGSDWEIVFGPGTGYTEDELYSLGIPEDIVNFSVRNSINPPSEISY